MYKLKELIFTFTCITTGTTLAVAIFISIFWKNTMLEASILWQILGTSLVCSFGYLIPYKEEKTKRFSYLFMAIHYVYINVIVLGCGFFFEWYLITDLAMVFSMCFLIAVIYIAITYFIHLYQKKDTEVMNERLHEYYSEP